MEITTKTHPAQGPAADLIGLARAYARGALGERGTIAHQGISLAAHYLAEARALRRALAMVA